MTWPPTIVIGNYFIENSTDTFVNQQQILDKGISDTSKYGRQNHARQKGETTDR